MHLRSWRMMSRSGALDIHRPGRGDRFGHRNHVPRRNQRANSHREKQSIFQFSSVGEECQDKKYAGEPTELIIGDNNVIRKVVRFIGVPFRIQGPQIGSNNLLMAYVHVAHDCIFRKQSDSANAATLAGHVHVDDWAILGRDDGASVLPHRNSQYVQVEV